MSLDIHLALLQSRVTHLAQGAEKPTRSLIADQTLALVSPKRAERTIALLTRPQPTLIRTPIRTGEVAPTDTPIKTIVVGTMTHRLAVAALPLHRRRRRSHRLIRRLHREVDTVAPDLNEDEVRNIRNYVLSSLRNIIG